jgi:hypothetical protein
MIAPDNFSNVATDAEAKEIVVQAKQFYVESKTGLRETTRR